MFLESHEKTVRRKMMSEDRYEITDQGYGKSFVRILHVRKNGLKHSVKEFEVNTILKLNNQNDYKDGNNRNIVATDTQKNTVYILAKKYGIETAEGFAVLLCQHFLQTYGHIVSVNVKIDESPWERITKGQAAHNHAFVFKPTALRSTNVSQTRNGPIEVTSSLTGLRVLKTTQSSFENFVRDDYTTLPETGDRIFSTVVDASWVYSTHEGVDFNGAWNKVKEAILDNFAGNVHTGIASPSVQNTLYLAEQTVLDNVRQISKIMMVMPNKHYFNVDFTKFPAVLTAGDQSIEVFQAVDKPSGLIRAELSRRGISKL